MKELVDHVGELKGGKLPRAVSKDAARPPTASPSTPTPTATPLPHVDRFNAGTWTLDLKVTSNNCPGETPAVGSTITVVYEFTDSTGDGYIYPGELFAIDQLSPVVSDLGAVYATLPTTRFAAEATAVNQTGAAQVELTFTAEDETLVSYIEAYGNCTIRAE
jgi:hypothetical protein